MNWFMFGLGVTGFAVVIWVRNRKKYTPEQIEAYKQHHNWG